MDKTLEFCKYHLKKGPTLINTTNHILRVKELDGAIIEIPSSVLPVNIPDSYEAKARELKTTVREVCDSSLFIEVEREWVDDGCYMQYERFKYDEEAVLDIFSTIRGDYPRGLDFIIGTYPAARAFPDRIKEPVYIDSKIYLIESNKFKAYYDHLRRV